MELNLIPILQAAVSPVILISGVGLLLLSMTNRLGRVIDRSRNLIDSVRAASASEKPRLVAQLHILARRARSVRLAITLATFSVLLAAGLVMVVFIGALGRVNVGAVCVALFIACLASLVGSVIFFLRDINLSLAALKLELASVDQGASDEI
ncbi:MAG TPA: DUF2721 domain-containing protein [Verrucomicrobiae bacterium]|nr:DUF2721 domain-containing protein [Verrucomicrobiae bacterium]